MTGVHCTFCREPMRTWGCLFTSFFEDGVLRRRKLYCDTCEPIGTPKRIVHAMQFTRTSDFEVQ